jgi:prepilin-type N-terminal cleavage/methylation domain-containing protein
MQSNTRSGFTIVEVLVAAAILGSLMIMLTSLAQSGADASDYSRRLNRVTEVDQDIVDGMRMDLVSSVTLYGRDALSAAHYNSIDLTAWPRPIDTSLLPRVAPTEELIADATQPATPKTGNELFFARRAWVDFYRVPTSGRSYMTDVYQWVLYYLTKEGVGPRRGTPDGLNLVRWVSEPLADATRVLGIADPTDRRELCDHLYRGTPDANGELHEPLQMLWTRGANPTVVGTFLEIDPGNSYNTTTLALAPRAFPFKLQPFRRLQAQGMLAYRHHSVASIYAQTDHNVCLYGIQSTSLDGFPHGFEVQIIGPSAARQVVVRLFLVSTNNRGLRANAVMQTVADCHDI